MTAAAIYARVSSARQAKDETIGSQLAALRDHAVTSRLEVPEERVFADEGHSGATLVRPGLEALRDLCAQGCLDVVLVYSPDRLARKFAYQALLIGELARCGVRVEFVKGPRGDSPEDRLLIQFQGMFAEYEKAQLAERYRRGKAWRAKTGSVNVLGGAPFGYRYVRKTPECGARYEVVGHEAALVAEMFRRYADGGASIADLRRWLTDEGVPARTGKERWDRSVIWGMLRNPAYAGTAVFGKTQAVHEPAGLNRTARLAGRTVPRQVRVQDRPKEEWTGIPVPALVDEETFGRVQQRLADNKRFAARSTKVPSLLQGLAACASCGYGYYRTSTTTSSGKKTCYYRCLGSDDYRYQGGRVCASKPVRAGYADAVVWDHVTALLADPALIRAEIGKRLERARTSDPVTRKRGQLEQALAKTTASTASMITAFSEQLITIDELRARMPGLRARETSLKDQIAALDAQAADRDAYLKLAGDLEGFLARLRANSATASVEDRQRVLRAVVQDILIGPEKLTIRHRIPVREPSSGGGHHDKTDTEGDMRESSLCVGGVISPLLLNVALHGLEEAAGVRYKGGRNADEVCNDSPTATRYADDFAICCHSRKEAENIHGGLAEWLARRGLSLNEEKTRVVHLSEGFDFPGWNFRRYPAGKLLAKPSKTAVRRHRERLADEMRRLRGSNAGAAIARLNPVIRGWTAYHRGMVSKDVFESLSHYTWQLTYKRARFSHSDKPVRRVTDKYYGEFRSDSKDKWVFGDKSTGAYLLRHNWTEIRRHALVKGRASPDDPDLAGYWDYRRKKHPFPIDGTTAKLLTKQEDRCPACGSLLIDARHLPSSAEEREDWWISVTRQDIPAALVTAGPRPPEGNRTIRALIHAACKPRRHSSAARQPAAIQATATRNAPERPA